MKIRDMNISARAKSCLLSAGYMFASEIVNLSDEQLLSIRNLNEKCLEEIREALDSYSPEDEKKKLYNERTSHSSSRGIRLYNTKQEDDKDDEDEDYYDDDAEPSDIVTAAKSAYEGLSKLGLNVLDHHLRMSNNFKFDDLKMFDLFLVPLFYDNMQRHTIARTIIVASDRVCKRNGL